MQFDGVTDDVYLKTRGEALFDKKMQVIENCRRAGIKIVFVPTIVKGINDDQLGDILRVAINNIDTMSGISFQPVAFTGRISRRELEQKRFTLTDLAFGLSEQTGIFDKYDDWFPLSCVTPFSKLLAALRGEGVPTISSHAHCSLGNYLFVDERSRKAVPVTRFVDIPSMLQDMDEYSRKMGKTFSKYYHGIKAWNQLKKHFKPELAPPGLTFQKFLDTLQGMTNKELGRNGMDGTFTYRTLLVAGMHFMDNYNYDIQRVKRCVIHYAAPDGKLYPFCTYNSGPTYREKIEKQFSIPFEKQLERFPFVAVKSNGGNGKWKRKWKREWKRQRERPQVITRSEAITRLKRPGLETGPSHYRNIRVLSKPTMDQTKRRSAASLPESPSTRFSRRRKASPNRTTRRSPLRPS